MLHVINVISMIVAYYLKVNMFIFQVTQEHPEDFYEWQFQQQTSQAQQASREEFIRHQRDVPQTPGRNWHFTLAGITLQEFFHPLP
jgi:hypothetical protein